MVPPKFPANMAGHFVPTNISLPCNAGIAVWTSCGAFAPRSPLLLKRELRLVSVERRFQPNARASLATFASVLSSIKVFNWGRLLHFIICENEGVSRGRFISPRLVKA